MVTTLDSVWDISDATINNQVYISPIYFPMMEDDARMIGVLGELEGAGLIAVTFVPKRKVGADGWLKDTPGCFANFRWKVTKKGKAYQKEHGVDLSAEFPGGRARNFEQMNKCADELYFHKNK